MLDMYPNIQIKIYWEHIWNTGLLTLCVKGAGVGGDHLAGSEISSGTQKPQRSHTSREAGRWRQRHCGPGSQSEAWSSCNTLPTTHTQTQSILSYCGEITNNFYQYHTPVCSVCMCVFVWPEGQGRGTCRWRVPGVCSCVLREGTGVCCRTAGISQAGAERERPTSDTRCLAHTQTVNWTPRKETPLPTHTHTGTIN